MVNGLCMQLVLGRAFRSGPSVVATFRQFIDLFKFVAAHIREKHPPTIDRGLDRESKGIAYTNRIDGLILAGGLVQKGIVCRDRSIVIDAEDFSLKCLEILCWFTGSLFTNTDVELSIISKSDDTTLMPGLLESAEGRLIISL